MQNDGTRLRRRRNIRLKTSNHFKCLLCYLLCFSLPIIWQLFAVGIIYPAKLTGTAPDAAAQIVRIFPFTDKLLSGAVTSSALPDKASPEQLLSVMKAKESFYLRSVLAVSGAAWLVTLLCELIWRFRFRKPVMAARTTRRAVRSYRTTLVLIGLVNLFFACLVWIFFARFISGKTIWDYLLCFAVYPMNVLAAFIVFRLAAPPSISAKHGFFKRL